MAEEPGIQTRCMSYGVAATVAEAIAVALAQTTDGEGRQHPVWVVDRPGYLAEVIAALEGLGGVLLLVGRPTDP